MISLGVGRGSWPPKLLKSRSHIPVAAEETLKLMALLLVAGGSVSSLSLFEDIVVDLGLIDLICEMACLLDERLTLEKLLLPKGVMKGKELVYNIGLASTPGYCYWRGGSNIAQRERNCVKASNTGAQSDILL